MIPMQGGARAIDILLKEITRSGPSLVPRLCLKTFRPTAPSPGLCRFPRPGATLALDFLPNRGKDTLELLSKGSTAGCPGIRRRALSGEGWAGSSAEAFRRSFPRWRDFLQNAHKDEEHEFGFLAQSGSLEQRR